MINVEKIEINNRVLRHTSIDFIPYLNKDDIYLTTDVDETGNLTETRPNSMKFRIKEFKIGEKLLNTSSYSDEENDGVVNCDLLIYKDRYYICMVSHTMINMNETLSNCYSLISLFNNYLIYDINKYILIDGDILTIYYLYGLMRKNSYLNIQFYLEQHYKLLGAETEIKNEENKLIDASLKNEEFISGVTKTHINTFLKYGKTNIDKEEESNFIMNGVAINLTQTNNGYYGDLLVKDNNILKYVINGKLICEEGIIEGNGGIKPVFRFDESYNNVIYTHKLNDIYDEYKYKKSDAVVSGDSHYIREDFLKKYLKTDINTNNFNIDRNGKSVNENYIRIRECKTLEDLINNGNGFFKIK